MSHPRTRPNPNPNPHLGGAAPTADRVATRGEAHLIIGWGWVQGGGVIGRKVIARGVMGFICEGVVCGAKPEVVAAVRG